MVTFIGAEHCVRRFPFPFLGLDKWQSLLKTETPGEEAAVLAIAVVSGCGEKVIAWETLDSWALAELENGVPGRVWVFDEIYTPIGTATLDDVRRVMTRHSDPMENRVKFNVEPPKRHTSRVSSQEHTVTIPWPMLLEAMTGQAPPTGNRAQRRAKGQR